MLKTFEIAHQKRVDILRIEELQAVNGSCLVGDPGPDDAADPDEFPRDSPQPEPSKDSPDE